jgi:cardiolipin synthase A/B
VPRRTAAMTIVAALLASLLAGCASQSDPEAANDIRIYQVLPVARKSKFVQADGEGEAIALINGGDKPHSLAGWMISTGSGKLVLPKLTLDPGKTVYLAHDAEYFKDYWSFAPDFEFSADSDKAVPDLKVERQGPVLADQGDAVRLLDDHGALIDILAYGAVADVPAPWSGPAVQLVNSFPITPANQVITRMRDSAGKLKLLAAAASFSGGTPTRPDRVYFAGQTDFPVRSVTGQVYAVAASAPDNAGPMLFDLVDKAKKSIRMVGYQFTNKTLADKLIAAQKRGVKVQVAIERNPGGGDMFDSDKEVQGKLNKGGVDLLYYYKWDGDLSTRYNPVHSKYAIIDNDTAVIASGNWTESVYSSDPSCGNREWIAAFSGNPDVVKLFREVWDSDFAADSPEVRHYDEKFDLPRQPDTYDPGPCFPYSPVQPAPRLVAGQATVTRILSPDNTMDRQNGFLGQLRNAKQELLISANYINLWWGDAADEENLTRYPDPYIEELLAAARRGVRVKVLLDRRDVKAGNHRDNQYVVQYLNLVARMENLKLEARLVNLDGAGIGRTYHNKSLIVDDATVISSINGSENSFRYAREMAIKVEGLPTFTDYYRQLFQHDWDASSRPNQPWGLMAVPRTGGTYLDWTPDVELDIAGYEIVYKPEAGAQWVQLGTAAQPGFRDEEHETGVWGVAAVTKAGARSHYAEVKR